MTSFSQLFRVFLRIGLLSFGGPAAQIALMHKELVEDRAWLTEAEFLRALSFCMMLPGPEAMQLAAYSGWRLRGIQGGLIAGGLFVLPGALIILLIAPLYLNYGALPIVKTAFIGIKATVVIIVFQALRKMSAKTLQGRIPWLLSIGAFAALFLFSLPFPLVILCAAGVGAFALAGPPAAPVAPPDLRNTARVFAIGICLWLGPLALFWFNEQTLLTEINIFFAKLAVITFGGAYAVLAYITQVVVVEFGWLSTAQMIDALGLAETTPGPLILVTEFVGFLAAAQSHGIGYGLIAAFSTLWMTFVPCFIWIFAGAPYLEWIATRPRLTGALAGISAAVVGVIANLSLWFSLHVMFPNIEPRALGLGITIPWPPSASTDWVALICTVLAGIWMLGLRRGMLETLVLCAAAALLVAGVS